jgi:sugar phosphate isomerase/epimerase
MKIATPLSRRNFLQTSAGVLAVGSIAGLAPAATQKRRAAKVVTAATAGSKPLYEISLAQWSLHKAFFAKKLDPTNFPKITKSFGITGVEFVNQFYKEKKNDNAYFESLKKQCDSEGVKGLLIMCDGEGYLGDADTAKRKVAVKNHHRWVDNAKILGCHSIRVNAYSTGTFEEQQERAADGLNQLAEYGEKQGINIIVENHGGLSSNGEWLAGVMKKANNPRVGTLPDFGNFNLGNNKQYDRYKGVEEMMPFAKGVSAKSHDFNEKGDEIHTDYFKMMKIVLKAGYTGYVGIEYEGGKIGEEEGIVATKKLLERVREELAKA